MKWSIISRNTEGAFRYQAWPSIAKGEDGTLFVGASGHRLNHICPFGMDLMYISNDEGESWTPPMIVNDTWLDDRDAGLLAWGNGNLLLSWFSTAPETFAKFDPFVDTRPHYAVRNPLALGMREMWKYLPDSEIKSGAFTKISKDNGKTWSEARRTPVFSPHGPCLLSDGNLFYMGMLNETVSEEQTPPKTMDMDGAERGGNQIYAYISHDVGATWELVSKVPAPEGANELCCEPHAIQLGDGTIIGVVRYHISTGHGNRKMYIVHSKDNGKTWESATMLDVWGSPGHLLQHSSGAIVLVYGKRRDEMGQYVIISDDGGYTWSPEKRISPIAPDWDHGYPSSVELENGDILTVYYQKCPGDEFNSLHSVRWNLKEVQG